PSVTCTGRVGRAGRARRSRCVALAAALVACASNGRAAGSAPTSAVESLPDSATFEIAGDPRQAAGAPWSFRGTIAGVRYDLTGVLLVPDGPGPFPAVVLSHGSGGNAHLIA